MTIITTLGKKYSPAFKAQIVQGLLNEEQTLTQIASRHETILFLGSIKIFQ
jgi:transposase-like protein